MLYLFKHSYYVLLVFALLTPSKIIPQSIYFNHLTTEDGLSNNNVYDVIQDHIGFLWFATDDGLNRFDGYDFKVFRNDPANQISISDNSVWALREDRKGFIWIGTKNGWLNRYDPVSEKFKKWKIESDVFKENAITFIYEDSKGLIWVGTYRSGLYNLDPSTNKIDHWSNETNNNSSISNNYISSVLEDSFGNLWVSTYNGLNKLSFQSSSKRFSHYFHNPSNPNSISNNIVWYLTQSDADSNVIWIGTANGLTKFQTGKEIFSQIQIPNPDQLQFGNGAGRVIEEKTNDDESILWIDSYAGLIRLNIKNGSTSRFIHKKNDPNTIISNQIHRIFKDRSGVLWAATDEGLSYFSLRSAKFNYLFSENFNLTNPEALRKKNINAIIKTSDGRIWFGTDEGLFYLDRSNNKIVIKKISQSEKLNVWSLASGSDVLWIGTYGSGLFYLDLKTNLLGAIPNYKKSGRSQAVNYIKSLCVDNNKNLWIGFWGMGLARFDPSDKHYEGWLNEKSDSNSLSFDDVWVIHQDRKGRLWIGTDGGGLNLAYRQASLFNKTIGEKFYCWTSGQTGRKNLSSRGIYSICEALVKNKAEDITLLWIGTNNGLNKFIVKNSESKKDLPPEVEIKYFTIKDGLADNSVKSIIEDDDGNLW
jgi:ligand-binding sensor domain-containing protein